MELIRLEDITKTYYLGEVSVPVLKGVSLEVPEGGIVASPWWATRYPLSKA